MRLVGRSKTVLIEQIHITKYIFMYFLFSENPTKLHKVKFLSSL